MPPAAPSASIPLEEMLSRLERALRSSPAEATEMVWIEARRGQESNSKRRRDSYEQRERTVLVRVRESSRRGFHSTAACEVSDLDAAIRVALAQARLSQPLAPGATSLPEGSDAAVSTEGLHDAEIAKMTPERARELVQRLADRDETVRLGWAAGRVAVANSRGLRRTAEVTSALASVTSGRGPGAGFAAAASRSLAGLGPSTLRTRARERQSSREVPLGDLPPGPIPVVLSQEAMAALLELLRLQALTSNTFWASSLRQALGQPVFHPMVNLRDDAANPRGLPFPFDLLGSAKRPLALIEGGVFLTPVLDERLARELERRPTAHLVAPGEASPNHLFLAPGEQADSELLSRAEGGLWIGILNPVEAFDSGSLRFRATAAGVRSVEQGKLGAPLPDLLWEDDLGTLLCRVLGVGSEAVTVPLGDGLFGGITAPVLALERVERLQPIPR